MWHKVRKKTAFLGKIIADFGTTEADIANVASVARVATWSFQAATSASHNTTLHPLGQQQQQQQQHRLPGRIEMRRKADILHF